jgi:hypothetical protein
MCEILISWNASQRDGDVGSSLGAAAMRSEPLTPGRREWLITAYLAYQGRTKPLTRAERLREPSTQGFRASQIMTDLVWDDPEAAWSVLLELIQRARTRHQLDMIAIGPLASFISTHWETWIDRLEERATNRCPPPLLPFERPRIGITGCLSSSRDTTCRRASARRRPDVTTTT